jgi:hypothetical protein
LLNTVIPGLGKGTGPVFKVVQSLAPIADQALSDTDRGGVQRVVEKAIDGGYNQQLSRIPGFDKLRQSMTLAKRPSELNPLIQLRNTTNTIAPRRGVGRSYVEEID